MITAIRRRLFGNSLILKTNYARRDAVFNDLADRVEAADDLTIFFVLFLLCLFIPLVAPFTDVLLEKGLRGILDVVSNFPLFVFIIFLLTLFAAGSAELVDNIKRKTELKRKLRLYKKIQSRMNRS